MYIYIEKLKVCKKKQIFYILEVVKHDHLSSARTPADAYRKAKVIYRQMVYTNCLYRPLYIVNNLAIQLSFIIFYSRQLLTGMRIQRDRKVCRYIESKIDR